MARVFYLHWNRDEAADTIRALRKAGHVVQHHWSTQETARIEKPPDAFVISLARLPSHGRAYAEWCQESRQRRAIPLIFVDGEPDKVAATRKKFPGARYCGGPELIGALADALRESKSDAVAPAARRPPARRTRRARNE